MLLHLINPTTYFIPARRAIDSSQRSVFKVPKPPLLSFPLFPTPFPNRPYYNSREAQNRFKPRARCECATSARTRKGVIRGKPFGLPPKEGVNR